MKTIPLTQGKFALVDDEDYEQLNRLRWCARRVVLKNRFIWYAIHNLPHEKGSTRQVIWMHRRILNVSNPKIQIDHRNGNGLDNQKVINLRLASKAENGQNRHKAPKCTSKFKGVHWRSDIRKWRARITVNGHRIDLGYFDVEEDAARAYDTAAWHYFGKFALTNFNLQSP